MLVLKICVNADMIDEIHIQNTGYMNESVSLFGSYQYKIRKPEGFEDYIINHYRNEGCIELISQVMNILNDHAYETKVLDS